LSEWPSRHGAMPDILPPKQPFCDRPEVLADKAIYNRFRFELTATFRAHVLAHVASAKSSIEQHAHTYARTHTHTRLTALCPGLPG